MQSKLSQRQEIIAEFTGKDCSSVIAQYLLFSTPYDCFTGEHDRTTLEPVYLHQLDWVTRFIANQELKVSERCQVRDDWRFGYHKYHWNVVFTGRLCWHRTWHHECDCHLYKWCAVR